MFIIVNQDSRLVAASRDLLEALGAETIYAAIRLQDEGAFSLERDRGVVKNGEGEITMQGEFREILSGMGTLYLGTVEPLSRPAEAERSVAPSANVHPAAAATETPEAVETLDLLRPMEETEKTEKREEAEEAAPSVQEREEHPIPSLEEPDLIDLLLLDTESSEEEKKETVPESEEKSEASGADEAMPEEETLELYELEPESAPEETTPPMEEEERPAQTAPTGKEDEGEIPEGILELIEETEETVEVPEETEEPRIEEPEAEKLPEAEETPLTPAGIGTSVEEPHPSLLEEGEPTSLYSAAPGLAWQEPAKEAAGWQKELHTYQIDYEGNAAKLGLQAGEYRELLLEFVGDCEGLKPEFDSGEKERGQLAAASLLDATSLLQLRPLSDFFREWIDQEPEQQRLMITAFYDFLAGLRSELTGERTEVPAEETAPPTTPEPEIPGAAPEAPSPDLTAPEARSIETVTPSEAPTETAAPVEEEIPAPVQEETPVPAIDREKEDLLKEVEPVPIDFSVKIAAEELNLPEDLVLEFINDFARQGHEYLPQLIEAYRQKDLDKLQKTAHMLKGAASNLRIESMVENLYELQFDNEINRAPKRIQLFAGQLMSLDKYLQQMNS